MINLGAEHENLDQKAYSILKSLIIERKLLPGQKIPQEKLARDLGISRTPLISALKFLEQEKLVVEKDPANAVAADEQVQLVEHRGGLAHRDLDGRGGTPVVHWLTLLRSIEA